MKAIFLFACSCIGYASFAQKAKPPLLVIDKKVLLIGGSIGSASNQSKTTATVTNEQKNKGFNFSPSIGVGIKKNTIMGVFLNYTASKNEVIANNTLTNKSTSTLYGGGVFLRNYKNLGTSFYLLAQTNLGFFVGQTKDQTIGPSTTNIVNGDTKSVQLNFSPGFAYSINNHFQLELLFSNMLNAAYSNTKSSTNYNSNKTESNGAQLDINTSPINSLAVGFRVFL